MYPRTDTPTQYRGGLPYRADSVDHMCVLCVMVAETRYPLVMCTVAYSRGMARPYLFFLRFTSGNLILFFVYGSLIRGWYCPGVRFVRVAWFSSPPRLAFVEFGPLGDIDPLSHPVTVGVLGVTRGVWYTHFLWRILPVRCCRLNRFILPLRCMVVVTISLPLFGCSRYDTVHSQSLGIFNVLDSFGRDDTSHTVRFVREVRSSSLGRHYLAFQNLGSFIPLVLTL